MTSTSKLATLIYYPTLVFGLLLLLYTLVTWRRTRALVDQKRQYSDRWQDVFAEIRDRLRMWFYYFSFGNPKNVFRNLIITIVAFVVLYIFNIFYIYLSVPTFLGIFFILFVFLVWKLGQRRNRKLFEAAFPEVLQVINSAAGAGVGLLQALDRCGKDVDGPLGEEFRGIYRRISFGEDPSSVFEDSYTRYPYKEFYFFITIVKLNLSRGGQIKEVISRLSRAVANSKKMEQKKKAMTSEARMSAMIVACFPIAFFFFMQVMMPENFDFIMHNPSGRIVLYYVVGSESIGMGIIYWLMKRVS